MNKAGKKFRNTFRTALRLLIRGVRADRNTLDHGVILIAFGLLFCFITIAHSYIPWLMIPFGRLGHDLLCIAGIGLVLVGFIYGIAGAMDRSDVNR